MSDGNALVRFLYDYPWTSAPILDAVFGPKFKRLARAKETRSVTVPGVGTCYGVKQEKLSSVPGVRRRDRAKRYILDNYGKDALWNGGSPGLWGSDLLASVGQERIFWIRVWVDNGGAGVEALSFIRPRGLRFAPNLADLILAPTLARAEMVRRQLLSHWPRGKGSALIHARREEEYLRLGEHKASSSRKQAGKPLAIKEARKQLAQLRWKRLENRRREQNVGKVFLDLKEVDFDLLKYVGDNPLFSTDELATLVSHSVTGSWGSGAGPDASMKKARHRFFALEEKGLIERAAPPMLGMKVSALGLEVLAKYWGIHQEHMRRFHPWPQKRKGGNVVYSEKALTHIKHHTLEVQRFVFGLLDSAWRLHKPHGGVDVFLETIIGKRIYFKDLSTGKYDFVIPDAVIDLSFWRRSWRDGKVHEDKTYFSESQLFLEIDRATNPITRLEERIQQYGKIWRGLSGNPAQVWVIDGSPWREKEILEMLGKAGINGWTVLVERLRLERDDPWWGRFSHKQGALPYDKHGGVAPLRKVWRNTEDYRMYHLLGHAPWEREMFQTKPFTDVPRGY